MARVGQGQSVPAKMDDLDRQIVKFLRRNARRSYASIARALNVSEPTVRNRVERLINQAVVRPTGRVNPAAVGLPVDVMVGIRVNPGYAKSVGAKLAAMENVAYVGYTTGSFDILIEAHLPDNEGLYTFLNEDLGALQGISYTETWHILHTLKSNFDWEGEDLSRDPREEAVARAPRSSVPRSP